MKIDIHLSPITLGETTPQYAALSDFHLNPAVGCIYGCRHCFIPALYSKSQANVFATVGVVDGEAEHGDYFIIRPKEEHALLKSLERAEERAWDQFSRPGVVLLSSTTDPYQKLPQRLADTFPRTQEVFDDIIERLLILLLYKTGLRMRILTRSPYARRHFEFFREFGDRLQFGMSIPTLHEALSHIYEPGAASPEERLKIMRAAKKAGLRCFVSMSPTYPECDEHDFRRTLAAITELNPVTIFHEPVNIRGRNLERLPEASQAAMTNWNAYALRQFHDVHRIASELGIVDRLHFMPDASLRDADPQWFDYWRSRRPRWPE